MTQFLYGSYWEQWYKDTAELVGGLQQALQSPQQCGQFNLIFERWFLELKVSSELFLLARCFAAIVACGLQ